MFESSTGLARALLSSPPHPVLEVLGKKLSFKIAVGINGRFWVNVSQLSTVILVGNAIQKSESLSWCSFFYQKLVALSEGYKTDCLELYASVVFGSCAKT
ncbi:putative exosome complex RNA-binding protein 1/RRP40/RRP4 [Helianthus anomalus]